MFLYVVFGVLVVFLVVVHCVVVGVMMLLHSLVLCMLVPLGLVVDFGWILLTGLRWMSSKVGFPLLGCYMCFESMTVVLSSG